MSDSAESFETLRIRLLRGTAAQFSIEPISSTWGVLMELGLSNGVATLVALEDGSANIYFSTGGGVFGGGNHRSIAILVRRLVALASVQLDQLPPTSEFPLPSPGKARFYVLTTEGVRTGDLPIDPPETHPLIGLYAAGQDVISGLRQLSTGRNH